MKITGQEVQNRRRKSAKMDMYRKGSAAESWKPEKVSEIAPFLRSTFLIRWECERFYSA